MKIEDKKNNIQIASRCAYLGFAALWWFANKQHFILSEWDAQRINVPMTLYIGIPILAFALYSIRPSPTTWVFVIAVYTTGYGLHVYESLKFDIIHMDVKTDIISTATQMTVYLLVFALCVTVLYMSGPYIRKKYEPARKI